MVSARLALTLRWAETGPLLRWAQVTLLYPYVALGLDFGAYASSRVSGPGSFLESSPSLHWAPNEGLGALPALACPTAARVTREELPFLRWAQTLPFPLGIIGSAPADGLPLRRAACRYGKPAFSTWAPGLQHRSALSSGAGTLLVLACPRK